MYELFGNPEDRFSCVKAQSLANLKYKEPHPTFIGQHLFLTIHDCRLKIIFEPAMTYVNQYTKFDENPKIFSGVTTIIWASSRQNLTLGFLTKPD